MSIDVEEISLKQKQLEITIAEVNRQFGKNSIVKLGTPAEPWPHISTSALTLDTALGIGGLPRGRIIEIYGPESSGKTTICLSAIAEAQKAGGTCLFIDAEHSLDPRYASSLGVDMEDLLVSQPDYGEQALDIVTKMVKSGAIDVVVVDSVAALTPKAEIDGEMGDAHMGLIPRMMSKAMRMLAATTAETKTLVIFTNQIREKIGIMFGNPEITPGGRALRFQASVRIEVRKKEDLKDKEGNIVGVKTRAKVIKNKMAPPFKTAEFDIIYGEGIDKMGCLVDACLQNQVLTKSGAWIAYEGETVAQGRQNMIDHLKEDPDLEAELRSKFTNG